MGGWARITSTAALLVLIGGPGSTRGDVDSALRQEGHGPLDAVIDSLVEAEALAGGVPGVAIAVVSDGQIVVQRSWGVADIATGRPATDTTPFNIASVTKPFTSALVLQLATEGRLGLDDRARTHLPELPERYRDVTVRQLLTHTSGIARDLRRDNVDDPDGATYRSRLAAAPASAPPGTRFEYSNTGYTVLGWMVESVEGRALEDVLRARIFGPAGMRQARYRAPLTEDSLRARPHTVVDGEPRAADYVSGGFGSGGISMSAADGARFALALQAGRVLPPALAPTAWSAAELGSGVPVALEMFGEEASYGFGWFVTRYAGRPMMTHGGGIEGFSANLYHFPDEGLTILVMANARARADGTAPVDPLARRIADVCLAANACRREGAVSAPGDVVAANLHDGSVARFDGRTGDFRGYLVEPGAGGLAGATGVAFGPDGHLYVGSSQTNQVLRYDGRTGAFRDAFVDGGELGGPFSLIFGPDGNLYVSSATRHQVLRFDGGTGAFLGIAAADSTLGTPIGLRFGPNDGLLYVANARGASVDRFDAATGRLVDRFATGIRFASDLDFGPEGDLYVSSAAAFAVLRFDGRTGAFADTVVVLPDRGVPVGLVFAADGRLFISDFMKSRLFVLEPGADEAMLLASEGLAGPENVAVVPEDR